MNNIIEKKVLQWLKCKCLAALKTHQCIPPVVQPALKEEDIPGKLPDRKESNGVD